MSFGFSISDILCCGQLAYQFYIDLKDAPGYCQEFAKELLLLHQIISKIEALIIRAGNVLDDGEQATLGLCVDMCKDILFIRVAGVDIDFDKDDGEGWFQSTARDDLRLQLFTSGMDDDNIIMPHKLTRFKYLVCRRFRERSFARKIPKIRSALSTVIEKLTSFQVLVIQ